VLASDDSPSPSSSSSGGRNARIQFAVSGGGAGGMRPAVVIDDPATGGDDVVVELATTYGWHADVQDRWKDHGRYVGPVGGAAMPCCVPRIDARFPS